MTSTNIHHKEDLIVRYLCGDASPQEIAAVESMLQSDQEFRQLFRETRFVWEQSAKPRFNEEHDWQSIRRRIGFKQQKRSAISFFMKAAAVIALVLSVSAGLWTYWNVPGYGRWVVFETGIASDSVVLPDASIVFLNRNSSLKYLNAFSGNERKVTLQGEGYFEVESDLNRPFRVEMGDISVRVTGTAFHVDNSHKYGFVELNVTRGAVTIYNSTKHVSVNQGERAIAGTRSISKTVIPDNNYISWKTGLLEFNNASLIEITTALREHFDEIEDVQIRNGSSILVTTRFKEQSLEEISEELSLHFQKKFEIDNEVLVISD